MKKFVVLYRAKTTAEDQMKNNSPEQAKAGMEAWGVWVEKAGSAVIDMGAPLGRASAVGKGAEPSPEVVGYSVLQAESAESLRALLADHPHLMMPGACIELHEALPLPGM